MDGGGRTTIVQQPSSGSSQLTLSPQGQALFNLGFPQIQAGLQGMPLTNFLQPAPLGIAPLEPIQESALGVANQQLQGPTFTPPETSALSVLAGIPGLLQPFQRANPLQVPGLDPLQQQAVGQIGGQLDAPLLNSPEMIASQELASELQAPLGSSPATLAAKHALEDQFQQTTLPTIQNQMALAGLGRSGALGSSIAQARSGVSAATVPFLQQEMQQRAAAIPELMQFGQLMEQRPAARAQAAFQAGGASRDISAQQAAATQADFLRQQQLAQTETGTALSAVSPLQQLGQIAANRPMAQATTAFDLGEQARQLEQAQQQAASNDFLRRQALIESMMSNVTGATFPSALAQTQTSGLGRSQQNTTTGGLLGNIFGFGPK